MEKTLSVIALVFAVSLAACQPKPSENAPAPTPIESPMQQSTQEMPAAPVVIPSATASTPKKTTAQSRSTTKQSSSTPRLDALEKRVKRMEDAAKQYGFNF